MTTASDIFKVQLAVVKLWREACKMRFGVEPLLVNGMRTYDGQSQLMANLLAANDSLSRAYEEATLGAGPIVDNASEGEVSTD